MRRSAGFGLRRWTRQSVSRARSCATSRTTGRTPGTRGPCRPGGGLGVDLVDREHARSIVAVARQCPRWHDHPWEGGSDSRASTRLPGSANAPAGKSAPSPRGAWTCGGRTRSANFGCGPALPCRSARGSYPGVGCPQRTTRRLCEFQRLLRRFAAVCMTFWASPPLTLLWCGDDPLARSPITPLRDDRPRWPRAGDAQARSPIRLAGRPAAPTLG
jgi:hypothetical protein